MNSDDDRTATISGRTPFSALANTTATTTGRRRRRRVGLGWGYFLVVCCSLTWLTTAAGREATLVDATSDAATKLGQENDGMVGGGSSSSTNDIKEHHNNAAKNVDSADDDDGPSLLELVHRQLDWVKSKPGGFIHEHFVIRPYNENDPTSPLGVFAGADIPKDALLFRVPRDCLILTYDDDICDTVDELVTEMKLGNASQYEPYVTYLKRQPYGQLPTMWSATAKELLNDLLDHERLPPRGVTSVSWGCYDPDASLAHQQAAMLLTQRGWDEVLIPIYDLLGHRNGPHYWLNTRMDPDASVHDPNAPIEVFAARTIRKGEEIYGSYDQCNDCGARTETYGTAEILRDYGFVEELPQKWIFPHQKVSFTLDYTYKYDPHTGEVVDYFSEYDQLQVHWHMTPLKPKSPKLQFFQQQLARLEEFAVQRLQQQPSDVANHEWNTILQYHQALSMALNKLVEAIYQQGGGGGGSDGAASTNPASQATLNDDSAIAATLGKNLRQLDHGQRQMDWVRSNGGYVTDKIEIRKTDPSDPSSPYGVFATEDIAVGENILTIPRPACVVMTFDDNDCDTVELLAQEFALGNASKYEPYVTYLLETQPFGQLPALWSEAGRQYVMDLVSDIDLDEDMYDSDDDDDDVENAVKQVFPPRYLTDPDWIGCVDFDDPSTPLLHRHAAMLVHQRGWDEVLLPVFDMMNHRNGKHYLNTRESHSVHDLTKDVKIEAIKHIAAGDELYTTYDSCFDCGARTNRFGTPEMFRDYGFVERMEQKWIFAAQKIAFTLNYKYVDQEMEHPEVDDLVLTWLDKRRPHEKDRDFFEDQIERLVAMGEDELAERDEDVPEHEWDNILAFHHALLTALRMVVQWMNEEQGGGVSGMSDNCLENPDSDSCFVSNQRYNALDEMFDDEGYNSYVCKIDWSFPEYERLETVKSQYQKIHFIEHPEHHDVCFELDSTWQICGCYRPHYHEMGTHYPASFLPKLKRVLWVGGGDSMLLHEILKYNPDLELAIGLELDQKVTRGSFEYFGTQPHWDKHDKVQWWYGDAAKSLLMLPKEYFGTFDLILVDLSETVMSNSVTKELDIMAALSLLLKPEGIFMKNEIYFDKLYDLFKYSIHLHVYDVPVLCSQSFIFGSNKIDFMTQNLTDHDLKGNLLYKPFEQDDDRYFQIHEYGMNPTPSRHCIEDDEEEEEEPTVQDRSPGILMILEAENVLFSQLSSTDDVLKLLVTTLTSEQLSVVSIFSSADSEGSSQDETSGMSTATVVLKEGYVVARVWANHKYIAFDIHLWSSFTKMDSIKTALLKAVDCQAPKSSSAFRIAAGGMFGASTWKEDSMRRGPRLPQCEEEEQSPVKRNTPMEDTLVQSIVKESLGLTLDENAVAVVMCGPENKHCSSVEAASNHPSIGRVVTLWTCPEIAGGVEFQPDSGSRKFTCEKQILYTLEEMGNKVGVLVMDPTAEFAMAQIVHKIVSRPKNKQALFSDQLLVLAPALDGPNEEWRRVFVDQFREIYHKQPLFRSEVLYNTTSSSLEMGTFLAGDVHFIQHVHDVTEALEKNTELIGETRIFESGRFRRVKDPNPELFALPGDYDQIDPYEQWVSQQPLGRQTVLQFETAALTKDLLQKLLESTLKKMHIAVNSSGIRKFQDMADGCILFGPLENGISVIVLWDGRMNVTVNLFQTGNASDKFATAFAEKFASTHFKMDLILRDEMPRGYGRVVNFANDIGERQEPPTWAWSVASKSS